MRYILNCGRHTYLLPRATKVEQLLKTLGEMVELEKDFAGAEERWEGGDYRTVYVARENMQRVDLGVETVADDQIRQPPKRVPKERRLPAPAPQLPWMEATKP